MGLISLAVGCSLFTPQSVCGDHTAPGRQPSSSNPLSNVMTHTNPTICWNTSSSTQHSGASRQTTQSNQRGCTGWLFPGWRKGQGHKGNTSQRCLNSSHSNLRFRERGRRENRRGRGLRMRMRKGGRAARLWTVMLPLVAHKNPREAAWGSSNLNYIYSCNVVSSKTNCKKKKKKSVVSLRMSCVDPNALLFALHCYICPTHTFPL